MHCATQALAFGVLASLASARSTATATSPPSTSTCDGAFLSIASGAPVAPSAFSNALPSWQWVQTDVADICAYESQVPSSSLSAYTSWNNAVYSYYQGKSDDIASLSTCSDEQTVTQELSEVLGAYSTFSASGCSGATATSTTATTGTETGSTTTPSGVAARETGRAGTMAAAMAVGLAGAIIM
ncbi:hypothetical protein F5Y15DRAFT_333380 [Xylariaceae sp. FL0016]|nr:hypothetical protein F5Y15DRAFT_333380 [Xylariaceae sp. FL0016]